MIGGGAGDFVAVIGVEHCHVRGGVGVPADGVEESRIVGVEDGVGAAFVIHIECSKWFGRSEHGGFRISGMIVIRGQLDCKELSNE